MHPASHQHLLALCALSATDLYQSGGKAGAQYQVPEQSQRHQVALNHVFSEAPLCSTEQAELIWSYQTSWIFYREIELEQ